MYRYGVNATTLDDVRAASKTSKSQLYRHFAGKEILVDAVIDLQTQMVLEREENALANVDSLEGLERWRDALVQRNALNSGEYGCVLGSLANELADTNESARSSLADTFTRWRGLLARGLARMIENGTLRADADPEKLATGLMASLQGGYLLAQTMRDIEPMEIALDMALDQVRSFRSA
jgi:AcrR family transcriptional regulator